MPTSSDEEGELAIPMHPNLEVVCVSVQPFNNCKFMERRTASTMLIWHLGSRRLITYRRLPEGETSDVSIGRRKADAEGMHADELNAFRRKVGPFLQFFIYSI
jgi:tRNA (guanine10-N2)-methyltransferase